MAAECSRSLEPKIRTVHMHRLVAKARVHYKHTFRALALNKEAVPLNHMLWAYKAVMAAGMGALVDKVVEEDTVALADMAVEADLEAMEA